MAEEAEVASETFFPDFGRDVLEDEQQQQSLDGSVVGLSSKSKKKGTQSGQLGRRSVRKPHRGMNPYSMSDDVLMDPSLSESSAVTSGRGDYAQIMCPLCQKMIEPNAANMCIECLNARVDIAEGVSKELVILQCRNCERWYDSPRYLEASLESSMLLGVCLKRVRGLGKKVRLIDAKWLWTEEHSRRLRIEITIQKEVFHGAIVQKKFPVEFTIENQQCEDCQASFTHHSWVASVQVRQKVKHKRTFLFLEQLILKHGATSKCIGITEEKDGIDFFFASKSHANAFVGFLHTMVPIETKQSRRLISHDTKSNVWKFKYSFFVEIAPICRLDLVLLPPELRFKLGGKSPLLLCYKVTDKVHLVDPTTLHAIEFDSAQYFRKPFPSMCHSAQCSRFCVMQIEPVAVEGASVRGGTGSVISAAYASSLAGSRIGGGKHSTSASLSASFMNQKAQMTPEMKNSKKSRKRRSPSEDTGLFEDDSISVASTAMSKRSKRSKRAESVLSTASTIRTTIGKSAGSHKFRLAEVELVKEDEIGNMGARVYYTRTHLGGMLKIGDIVECYDLDTLGVMDADSVGYSASDGRGGSDIGSVSMTVSEALRKMKGVKMVPDVMIARKHFERSDKYWRRQKWKLKHLDRERNFEMDDSEQAKRADEEREFMRDLEEEFEMRCRINIFKKDPREMDAMSAASTIGHDPDRPRIGVEEMLVDLSDMKLSEDPIIGHAAKDPSQS